MNADKTIFEKGSKHNWVFFLHPKLYSGLMIILILSVTAYLFLNHYNFVAQRHHILCEVLKFGMSKDDVIRTLGREGSFTIIDGNWSDKAVGVISISFKDTRDSNTYFSADLVFRDNRYEAAYRLVGSDDVEPLCNFHQSTQSAIK